MYEIPTLALGADEIADDTLAFSAREAKFAFEYAEGVERAVDGDCRGFAFNTLRERCTWA